ncbi:MULTISPECIES: CHAD domain-containing protein [unclassified Oleiphilus]|nr:MULTISPECIES: CHAD domain-containing protein [unclassified Oleiphilus]
MKHLYLLRHAKSSCSKPSLSDLDRPLNKRGLRQIAIMSPILEADGALQANIYSSNAERARQTIQATLTCANSFTEVKTDKDLYTFSRKKLLKWLHKLGDDENEVLIVGHNPAFEELLEFLLKTPIKRFPTCSYVHLELDTPSWAALSPLQAKVRRLITPTSASYEEYMCKVNKAAHDAESDQTQIRSNLLKLHKMSLGLLPGCLADIDSEFVHQYRVCLRKTRSIASMIYTLTKDKTLDQHLRNLKQHAMLTGELRDLDVFLNYLSVISGEEQGTYGEGLSQLYQDLEKIRHEKLLAFCEFANSERFLRDNKQWKQFLRSSEFEQLCGKTNDDKLTDKQIELSDNISRLMDNLTSSNQDDDLHHIRKLIKKSRYLSELTGSKTNSAKQSYKAHQALFGRFQDLCVQCEMLGRYIELQTKNENKQVKTSAKKLLKHLQQQKTDQKEVICKREPHL